MGQKLEISAVGLTPWQHIGWPGCTECWQDRCWCIPLLGCHCSLYTINTSVLAMGKHSEVPKMW